MKIEETETLKLHKVNKIQTTTTQINHIQDSDKGLSKKITEILNLYEKDLSFKSKPSFKNGVTIAEGLDTALLNADNNSKTKKNTKIQRTKQIISSVHEERSKFTQQKYS